MNSRFFALIPCAGIGKRFKSKIPKQYLIINNKNILYHSISAFNACSEITNILVIISPNDMFFDFCNFNNLRFTVRKCGGKSRQISVLNGLTILHKLGACNKDWILVHDAVRPCITPNLIKKIIQELKNNYIGGIMAIPVRDLIKYSKKKNNYLYTIYKEKRNRLWHAQTPQMFRLGMLLYAMKRAEKFGYKLSDEANAIELLGYTPNLIHGSLSNFKITYPEDLELAKKILLI